MALEVIHREVLGPLNHPHDLMAWCYLWEGLEPVTFASLDDAAIASAVRALARDARGGPSSDMQRRRALSMMGLLTTTQKRVCVTGGVAVGSRRGGQDATGHNRSASADVA